MAEAVHVLAERSIMVFGFGMELSVIRGNPGREKCGLVSFPNSNDGRQIKEPVGVKVQRDKYAWSEGIEKAITNELTPSWKGMAGRLGGTLIQTLRCNRTPRDQQKSQIHHRGETGRLLCCSYSSQVE